MNNTRRFWRSFDSFWQCLLKDIQRHQPHTVVLSSETLFHDFSTISERSFSEFLSQYFDEIQVVAYIRSPASDYKSRVSQQIRTAKKIIAPQVRPINSILEYYVREFPGAVKAHPFERGQLNNGDVLYDFLSHNLPEVLSIITSKDSDFKNIALPASLLQQLQEIRLTLQPNGHFPSIMTNALIVSSAAKYKKIPTELRTQDDLFLLKEISEFLQKSATDYLWLKKHYDITFNDLDYSQIKQRDNPYKDLSLLKDICTFDNSRNTHIEQIDPPKSKILKLLITASFINKTQMIGLYRYLMSYTWLGKLKRAIYK
jgi:hypothetical protein